MEVEGRAEGAEDGSGPRGGGGRGRRGAEAGTGGISMEYPHRGKVVRLRQ